MKYSGARYQPELDEPEISYEHWHRYLFAARFARGKRVLDIACGEGFGSRLLAETAEQVVGVDADPEAVAHATRTYRRSNLAFICGAAEALPLAAERAFDVVVSFETIEHLSEEQQQRFGAEIKRLVAPHGLCIISTPNKQQYSDRPGYDNPFHRHEFYEAEFLAYLRRYFQHVDLLGQRVFPVSYIWSPDAAPSISHECQLAFEDGRFRPLGADRKERRYVVAMCSDAPLVLPGGSLLLDISERATTARLQQLSDATRAVQTAREELKATRQERTALLRAANEQREQARREDARNARRHEAAAQRLQRAAAQRLELKRRVAELARERDALRREVAALRELAEEHAALRQRADELVRANETTARELAELGGALAEHKEQALEREQELRALLLDAHAQLLRRDVEIDASLSAELSRRFPTMPRALRHRAFVEQVRAVARATIPLGTVTLVASLGDDELLQLDGVDARPFPQAADGTFPGYSLVDSRAAIDHLEELRELGATFFLVPDNASGWLAGYPEFESYLSRAYRAIVRRHGVCTVFALRHGSVDARRRPARAGQEGTAGGN